MVAGAKNFTVGVEEEYLLVDRDSRQLIRTAPTAVLEQCVADLGSQVKTEFQQSQVEVNTEVCETIGEVRDDLRRLRETVARYAETEGLALVAASTHPSAKWEDQQSTPQDRYIGLARDLQGVGRRLITCGMHIHICIDEDDLRLDLMNQVTYFLPHLLALSTSSPFWHGEDTGLASYRLSIFDNLPRTGLPETFASWAEYQRHVNVLANTGVIEDASMIWWDIRPSVRFPTIEMRICDVCTKLEDAVVITALFQCLVHMLFRLRRLNQRWRDYAPMLVAENRWRAQRYGIDAGLIDFGRGAIVPFPDLLDEILDLLAPDADELGCTGELLQAREIVARGTSAHRQRRTYQTACAEGAGSGEALRAVVDMLIAESKVRT
ncbi:MAG: carboxylate-amine ligase [Rhodospirillales bacterium]|nr:carboxylate-amine ligase [Rhodospirillales bacterium]